MFALQMRTGIQLKAVYSRRVRPQCPTCASKTAEAPRPAPKFTKADLKRIKQEGPRMADLLSHHEIDEIRQGKKSVKVYDFVPYEVMGNPVNTTEPKWQQLPQMSIFEFLYGIQQRNWTSKYYDASAQKWDIQIFSDSGRFMRPIFPGYRAHVTRADGSAFWVDMPHSGQRIFLNDYTSSGKKGALFNVKRSAETKGGLSQYGYNQVFEELFAAFEQKVPTAVKQALLKNGYVPDELAKKMKYDCPADQHLSLAYCVTPDSFSLSYFWGIQAPRALYWTFAFSFLAVCIAIGAFRPRKQMPGDYIQAQEFAQSKGKARKEGTTSVRFTDVAGINSVKNELQEIVEFLTRPDDPRWKRVGMKPPKGVLLEGDPGTGKTLIAKAIAGEAGVPFYQMSGSEFVEIIVGVGAARVRDLFKRARVNAPCIVFVDEIDALGIRRAEGGVQTNEEREQTLNQLLTEIDGFEQDLGAPVVFMGATNRADLLDPALLRAGRFDRKIRVIKPDTDGRYAILKVHARRREKHFAVTDEELYQLAKDLPGLSGAELENILNEAALEAIRTDSSEIGMQQVYNAIDRVVQGVRRPQLPEHFFTRRLLASYEAGKGVIAHLIRERTGRLEKVERVSMVPRGVHWTRTTFMRGDDATYTLTTRGRVMDRLHVLLAGRAAEIVMHGTATTYASKDLRDAHLLAEKLIGSYALSDLGILTWAPPPKKLAWGRKMFETGVDNIDEDLFGRNLSDVMIQPSDATLDKLKRHTLKLVLEAYRDNLKLLYRHKAALEQTAEKLLQQEILTGDELAQIIEQNRPSSEEPLDAEVLPHDIAKNLEMAFHVATQ